MLKAFWDAVDQLTVGSSGSEFLDRQEHPTGGATLSKKCAAPELNPPTMIMNDLFDNPDKECLNYGRDYAGATKWLRTNPSCCRTLLDQSSIVLSAHRSRTAATLSF